MQRTSLNASKSSLAISERRKSLNKILNRQRSTIMIARKINSAKTYNHVRLVGGADISEEPNNVEQTLAEASPSIQEIPPPPPPSPTPLTPSPSSVKESVNTLPAEESTRSEITDKKSHEDKEPISASGPCCFCVSQMPRLVGDRKVDEIIEYVHQNLEEAGKALATLGENFEHELKLMFVDILGRIKQWSGIVQNKLDACKNEIGNLHKELLARACEMDVLKAQITEYQNPSLLDESSKKNHKIIRPEQEKENKKIHAENSLAEDKKITNKDIVQVVDQIEKGDEERTEEVRIINQTLNYQEIKNTIQITDQTDEEVKIKMKEERARIVDKENEEEPVLKKEIKEDQIEATMAAPTTVLNKTKRESELESEITLLRKEYNRVIKERAEYENAIQRALLRGVSSLNVEALRVLRCPPIPCCIPCAPCPATAGIIPP
ncbi:hypothetical protein EAG_04507 [Camponotus floridanus]|uniref:Uncharacterized protein n=1 Tax=Camponotus floridanus TaxID=104421 RepID=E2AAG0_CAMFO|nr:hypothetical protein EAG_04507 [Camponotus floridanus]